MDKGLLKRLVAFMHLRFRAQGTELGVSAEEVIQEARQEAKGSEPSRDEDQPAEPGQSRDRGSSCT